jgi:hypothetical protein
LKIGDFAEYSLATSSQALSVAIRMSGGVRRICTPCFLIISSIASAFCFCQRVIQVMNVSFTAELTASCCSGVKLFQTSRLKPSSPIELFSCIPGV